MSDGKVGNPNRNIREKRSEEWREASDKSMAVKHNASRRKKSL